jgi:3-methylcrotonyl-CoA carboxylase beta subunit
VRASVKNFNKSKYLHLSRDTARMPLMDEADLDGVIPANPRTPFDMREIIARVADGSEFDEFKARYGPTLVTGFAHIDGWPVGIVANNGILFSESALKGAHFIELCSQRNIPLVFLQNITGFMVGAKAETGGIAKDGAKMVTAVACANVPKWPNARISVMGGEQAAGVLAQVKRDALEKNGGAWSAEDEATFKAPLLEQYTRQSSAYYATARLWDDGIIAPRDTRHRLAQGLAIAANAPIEPTRFGVFRM